MKIWTLKKWFWSPGTNGVCERPNVHDNTQQGRHKVSRQYKMHIWSQSSDKLCIRTIWVWILNWICGLSHLLGTWGQIQHEHLSSSSFFTMLMRMETFWCWAWFKMEAPILLCSSGIRPTYKKVVAVVHLYMSGPVWTFAPICSWWSRYPREAWLRYEKAETLYHTPGRENVFYSRKMRNACKKGDDLVLTMVTRKTYGLNNYW